jgi:hypothetical protein
MVKGLDVFREHFREFADRYVLIGGAACDLIMDDAGLDFRATKDLDIVLCVEALDLSFAKAFWAFIESGQYQLQEAATGKKRFYRFQKPGNDKYPFMLELFSRVPDALQIAEGSHLTPIPIDEEVSSLSAILLDEAYYDWIHSGKREIEGVPIVGPEYLVPLKAKAWLDLLARSDAGEGIDSKTIKKHKNDVFRLFQVIGREVRINPPKPIIEDMRTFVEQMATEKVDLKALGFGSGSLGDVIEGLRKIYTIQ